MPVFTGMTDQFRAEYKKGLFNYLRKGFNMSDYRTIHARQILDSRGTPTIEVDVLVTQIIKALRKMAENNLKVFGVFLDNEEQATY
jgi:hypothetical protein